jgi:hypothetical protein
MREEKRKVWIAVARKLASYAEEESNLWRAASLMLFMRIFPWND